MHTNAAIGYYRCPVCNKRHGDMLLVHGQAIFDNVQSFLGWALCERDEALHLQGFVALVEVEEEPDGWTAYAQLEAAEPLRTGNVFHVLRDRWGTMFLSDPPAQEMPLQFVTPDAAADARESSRMSLH